MQSLMSSALIRVKQRVLRWAIGVLASACIALLC